MRKLFRVYFNSTYMRKSITIATAVILLVVVVAGFVFWQETQIQKSNQTTFSPTPTKNTSTPSNDSLLTNYSITIPEFYKVGFGIAEIQMKFIAPTQQQMNQQPVLEANYSTTKLPITLSTNPSDETNQTLPPIINGTIINIKVEVYQYTMLTDNPRILAASQGWNETKYIYA